MELGRIARESLELIKKNYVLAIPTVLSVFLLSFISLAVLKHEEDVRGLMAMGFVSMAVSYFSHAVTLGLAKDALDTGAASFKRWLRASGGDLPRYLGMALLVGVLVGVGFSLFLLPGIAVAFLLIFAMPYAVIDRAGVTDSIMFSFRLAAANLRGAVTMFAFLFSLGLVLGFTNVLLSNIKVLGQLIGVVISGVFGGYASVVVLKAFLAFKAGKGSAG